MLEKWGDKHIAELMLDKHVALPSIHKWPCHVQRSQVWKSKDKLDGARGRCCFWVCLLAELVSLLFGRFSPWGTSSVKMTAERWLFLRDKTSGNILHQTLSLQRKISAWGRRRHRLFDFKGLFFSPCETHKLLSALTSASAALGPLGASLFLLLIFPWFQGCRAWRRHAFPITAGAHQEDPRWTLQHQEQRDKRWEEELLTAHWSITTDTRGANLRRLISSMLI